ncbi:MAG: UDP-N-acetyl-D-mannosamine dehydrogenase, partial [Gammaproteobacteria bacterium]|nr:UDP-N-acetyl-D-mannosamine dehydrogenase [Gammaproteobacteria bacterium]
ELSLICESLQINVWELIRLANHHPRVNILQPGPGVGGHCIAVDPWFIVSSAPDKARLIRAARQVNDSKPHWVIEQVKKAADRFKHPVIACLGVTFKADIDDIRESPSLEIAHSLQAEKVGQILVCEPNLNSLSGFELVSLKEALERADIILILVDHHDFKSLSQSELQQKVVIDTKGLLSRR